mgnify:CR=1 FL=1
MTLRPERLALRPKRSAHDALDALGTALYRTVSWVLDADIRSFFDTVSQEWLIRFVEHRIGDRVGQQDRVEVARAVRAQQVVRRHRERVAARRDGAPARGDGLRLEGRTPHASDRERFVLQMVEVRQTRYAELATVLGIRAEAIKMVVFRARKRIFDRIGQQLMARYAAAA